MSRSMGSLAVRVDANGLWSFHWNHVSAQSSKIADSARADTAGWHHLVAIHDGTTAKLFVDHVLRAEAKPTVTVAAAGMDIGAKARQLSEFANAIIDDVRLYDRALSETEIAQL